MTTGQSLSLSKQDRVEVTKGYIWYDFASAPQCIGRGCPPCLDTKEDQPAPFFSSCAATLLRTTGGWCRAEQVS